MADLKERFINFMGFGGNSSTAEDLRKAEPAADIDADMKIADMAEDDDYSLTAKDRYTRVSATKSAGTTEKPQTRPTYSGSSSVSGNTDNSKIRSIGINSNLRVVLSKPTAFENCEAICSHLCGQMTVVLNLEYVANSSDRHRIFDFVSGCAYALHCNIQRVSDLIYVVAPSNVDIFAEAQDKDGENEEVFG